jgi:hypothetical protein
MNGHSSHIRQGKMLQILDTRLGCYGIMDISITSPLILNSLFYLQPYRATNKFASNSVKKLKPQCRLLVSLRTATDFKIGKVPKAEVAFFFICK